MCHPTVNTAADVTMGTVVIGIDDVVDGTIAIGPTFVMTLSTDDASIMQA